MSNLDGDQMATESWLHCDCGYRCQGESLGDRVADGQRHAWEAHGIEVSADQILKQLAR
jgi:hypothetical protein